MRGSGLRRGVERVSLGIIRAAIYAFLMAPLVIVVLSALNAGTYLRFPPQGLSFRWFVEFAHSRSFMNSLAFSLRLAAIVTVVATILGTMASLWLTRVSGRFRSGLQVLIIAPLAVPGILTGIALLLFFYTVGWRQTGLADLVIGHTLICVPYVVLIVGAVLARQDKSLVEAARNLGAGPLRSFWRVIPAARLVDSNVIWCGSERYDSASPLDGGDSDDRSDHPFGAIGG